MAASVVDPGRVELPQRQDLARNRAQHAGRAPVLVEGIDPKPRQPLDLEGKVHLQVFLVHLALGVVHDVVEHGEHLLVIHGIHIQAAHIAVHANHGRQAGGQVQVRCLVFHAEGQQLGDVHSQIP